MKVSVSPITAKSYSIPVGQSDADAIDKFLARNSGKQVVVVQGLGFVGAVMALVCANAVTEEYAVIGVDLANEET
jgi:UDP-N-acetyl-D-glucosamine dehydrogenase